MSGCTDNNRAPDSNPDTSAGEKNTSSEEHESSVVMTSDNIPLRYAIYGQGSPVVCILGYGMTIDEWPHLMIDELAKSHTVIVYNHRGVSGINNPDHPFTIPQAALDLHDVIRELAGGDGRYGSNGGGLHDDDTVIPGNRNCSVRPVDIIGYSMGGMIALEYTKQYPDCVHRLVLISTDCGGEKRVPAADWVMEEMSRTPSSPAEYLDRAGRLLLSESFRKKHPDPRTWFVDYGEVPT